MKNKKQEGFTLIELMIVIVILGVLSMIGITAFTSSQVRSRDTKRKSDLGNLRKALEFYFNDYGKYPLGDVSNGQLLGCNGGQACNWGGQFVDDKGTTYMIRLPVEASGSRRYYYVSSDGKSYKVYAWLENSQDQDLLTPSASTNCASSGTLECNYGVASYNTTP